MRINYTFVFFNMNLKVMKEFSIGIILFEFFIHFDFSLKFLKYISLSEKIEKHIFQAIYNMLIK